MKSRLWIPLVAMTAVFACQREQATQVSQPAAFNTHLSFGIASFAINFGASMRLAMKLVTSSGTTTNAPASVVIVSRNPVVVRVDSDATIHADTTGSAWIVASFDTAGKVLTDSIEVTVECTAELVPVFTPPVKSLAVGESFAPTLKFSTCGGHLTYTDTLRWSAGDSTIVRVDSLSGATTGLRVGTTYLHAQSVRFGQINGLNITVHAP